MAAHDVEHIDRAIARVATWHDGVAGRDELLALGIGPEAIKHRLRTGRLTALHRGVYAVGQRGAHRLVACARRCWQPALARP